MKKNNPNKYKILVTGNVNRESINFLVDIADLNFIHAYPSEDELISLVNDIDAILARSVVISSKVIKAAKKLKIISRHGIGVDGVDVDAATKQNIIVTNVPAQNANTVSEHIFALLLALSRKIIPAHEITRRNKWERNKLIGLELSEKVMGIIGFGNIGRLVAKKAQAFGMLVIIADPFIDIVDAKKCNVKKVTFEELLKISDFINISVPLTKDTEYMIGRNELQKMKKSVFLINTSRGKIVDENALYTFLSNGRIAGAGLDVLAQEPPPNDFKLNELSNVIITPHIAGQSKEALEKVAKRSAENIFNTLSGKIPENVFNKKVLQTLEI
ncbi:hydroxyacid dehydrogenase [Thermodesulfobacteriota bacterium]